MGKDSTERQKDNNYDIKNAPDNDYRRIVDDYDNVSDSSKLDYDDQEITVSR